jgi:uncharacterized phage-like protein YoqJ
LPTVLRGLKINLLDTIEGLYKQGYRHFICGGALGFDTLAARAVLYLRTKKQGICLHLVLPCRNQCDGWSKKDTELYKEILLSAHEVVYLRDRYEKGCMHQRNRTMVDASSVCVAYLTVATGGTAYTVEYAREQGVEVINLGKITAPSSV